MASSNPSPSNTTAKSKANADVQSKWASSDERVVEWLAPQHSEGPRSDGRATFVVSVSVGRGTDPKNPKNFGLCTQTQSRFCGGASGCSLEEEPALGSFPVLADICRGFQEDMVGASEDSEEKTAEQRANDRVDGTDGGTGSDTSARSAHSRLALPDYLSKYFMSPAIRKLRAEPGGMETYSKAVDLDVVSMEKVALVSSLALAEGVSHVYHHWLKEDHYDLTDESRLVRIGAISDAEMQRLCASPSTEPWSFSTLLEAKPLPGEEAASDAGSEPRLASPSSQTQTSRNNKTSRPSPPSRRGGHDGKYLQKKKPGVSNGALSTGTGRSAARTKVIYGSGNWMSII